MSCPPPPPTWSDFAALLKTAAVLFGEPAALRADGVIERRLARVVHGWLVTLEAVARAMLLVMALALPRPTPRALDAASAPPPPPCARGRGRRVTSSACDDPSTELACSSRWAGVAFRLLPAARGAGGRLRGYRFVGYRFVETRPLARRLEALIRVAESPGRHARRLARLIARRRIRAETPLARRLLRWPRPPDPADAPGEILVAAWGRAWLALEAADTG